MGNQTSLQRLLDQIENNDPELQLLEIRFEKAIQKSKESREALYRALQKNFTVRSVFLWGIDMTDVDAQHLASALHHNQTIKLLSLRGNNIGDAGAKALAKVLADKASALISIDLGGNGIGNDGCKSLAIALQSNPQLQKLDLAGNKITAIGCKHLARALPKTTHLRFLDLSENKVGDEAGRYLIKNLKGHDRKLRVGLTGSGLKKETETALVGVFKEISERAKQRERDEQVEQERKRQSEELEVSVDPIVLEQGTLDPTDLENTLESEFREYVCPGSTVAYKLSEAGIGIVFELLDAVDVDDAALDVNPLSVQELYRTSHHVQLLSATVLKQGTVPKTKTAYTMRRETIKNALSASWEKGRVIWSCTEHPEGVSTVAREQEIVVERQSSARSVSSNPLVDQMRASFAESVSSGSLIDSDISKSSTSILGRRRGSEIDGILSTVLGKDFDPNERWSEFRMSSVKQSMLYRQVEEKVPVILPSNMFERFQTPSELQNFLLHHEGKAFPTRLGKLAIESDKPLPTFLVGLLQAFGICLILAILVAAVVPAYMIGTALAESEFTSEEDSPSSLAWQIAFLFVPMFMASLSLLVIIAKWLVIGQYRSKQIAVYSAAYLAWWFVDRLVHLWELWVGQFILGTPLALLFYGAMGCEIHLRTSIEGFIREFDLVAIGKDTTVRQQVRCRRFSKWTQQHWPTLRFRPISIGSRCLVDGMVSLGSEVRDDICLEKLSALAEGAVVGENTLAVGNPAFDSRLFISATNQVSYAVQFLKLVWLGAELGILYGLLLITEVIWSAYLPQGWRYEKLAYFVLTVLAVSFLAVHASALLKWLLIGKRTTGQRLTPTLFAELSNWVCDYHFRVSSIPLSVVSSFSRIWNVILMLHGFRVDFKSFMEDITVFEPSVMDQVILRRSFVSNEVAFRPGGTIEIVESTIGHRVVLSSAIKVHRSTIRAYSEVTETIYDENMQPTNLGFFRLLLTELTSIVYFVLFCLAFLPSFEMYQQIAINDEFVTSIGALAGSFVVQCWVWTAFAFLARIVTLLLRLCGSPTVNNSWYHLPTQIIRVCNTWGHWSVLWGTPFYSLLASVMGAKVKGDLFFNGKEQQGFGFLVFDDKVVVDDCHLNGHERLGRDLVMGKSVVRGVMHEGCYTSAGTRVLVGTEVGPWKAILGRKESFTTKSLRSSGSIV